MDEEKERQKEIKEKLGYPFIGTSDNVTVTSGVISGIEQDYYVTDAKIDHGNSGGAAILTKNDCWLGIPSAAAVGSIESLGRILKASLVLH
jgi:S1-C subfamily serine protease